MRRHRHLRCRASEAGEYMHLPGSFLPILRLTCRLAWRIRTAELLQAAETAPKFARPALQP